MTTIHGDPDIFVSSLTSKPTEYENEKRSTNSGIYPDVVEFELLNRTAKTFYILVKGWEDSTYTLTYFTHTSNGTIGVQRLMVGKKQKGVMHPNL